ncbi:hypothetical protein EST38_g5288 [Candolleomyces aberdarensis]|uniref:Nephrocystin 3-like N-terminal domain-containing protein n=1 Tax=Candolleomyces aberdarensis TaxID=2316362 RepID=A0A4Q2DMJ1_9AGAR|nr:hypothetical protein EST38_g5288 [Candolleomyces aberdarensis]
MRDLHVNHVTVNPLPNLEPVDGWKLLVENIAPNALHDSYARYDAPKCDEDTRVEVTRELMDRIEDRDSPQRLLCMTGAAGSGKSALQQTIAERCSKSGILGSAYFFSSADPTRNTTSTIVSTIAFQLGSHNTGLKQRISAVVAEDSVIFKRSLRTQMNSLLVRPLKHLQEYAGLDLTTLPQAILIDGLDECKGEDRQEELLIAIRECLLTGDLPFHIFIASRPEWAIRTALNPGGHLHAAAYHIQLSDKYDASGDMRRFLRRRFEQLSLRTGNPHWFTENDIETLVQAGSGQFIYVATVYRYISERRASPAERLKIVLTWTPHEGQRARPFEALDKLYTEILLNAKKRIHHANCSGKLGFGILWKYISKLLDMDKASMEILISDLHSLVTIRVEDDCSTFYLQMLHKSFSDFLDAESRAKDLYRPLTHVHAHLAKCCFLHILQSPDSSILENVVCNLPTYWRRMSTMDDEIVDFTRKGGWHKLDAILDVYSKARYSSLLEESSLLTEDFKNRDPEVAATISTFFNKWKRDYENFNRL